MLYILLSKTPQQLRARYLPPAKRRRLVMEVCSGSAAGAALQLCSSGGTLGAAFTVTGPMAVYVRTAKIWIDTAGYNIVTPYSNVKGATQPA